jgi:SpoVK/Ycf46/Vps4 family AAA+-type ATPase
MPVLQVFRMSQTHGLFLPQLPSWLTRLALGEATRSLLLRDAVVFATWYAIGARLFKWPAEVEQIQQSQRSRKMSLEQTMKLLGQLSTSLPSRISTSASQARELLEGYAVHEWVVKHPSEFREMVRQAQESFKALDSLDGLQAIEDAGIAATQQLIQALALNRLEAHILSFALLCTASAEMGNLVAHFSENRWASDALWTTVFDVKREELEKALRPEGALRLSGLLQPSLRKGVPVELSTFWLETLARSEDLAKALLEPYVQRRGAGTPARMLDEDLQLAAQIVKNEKGLAGVNLLLYGASRLDKRQLLKAVVEKAGRQAWRVRALEDASFADRPALVYVAQKLLAEQHPDAVLVVERPADALTTAPSSFLRQLFGIEFDPSEVKPFDENLLGSNKVPTVWLASSVDSLPDETVARFVFHAPLKKADRKDRTVQLEELLSSYKLTKKAREDILKLDGVSAVQLESAIKAAELSGAKTRTEKDAVVVQAVRRSQKALSRDITAKMKPSVTQYSLKYLNTSGRFGPEDILKCLKNRPKGALVFYGLPGTGKTQFVEYMAAELGMPLVTKKASELLSKWLGESEKNIAAAFEEAASEDAILLLDEGDSFLRDRSQARESWQITQVNELLQHIERFDGIVVVCTNLFQGLDAAALRRFTFKVEFRQLDADQRWEMFQVESGIKGKLNTLPKETRELWFEQLCFMRNLTAGDFATVKRQCELLGATLTPEEWLEQLKLECDVKRKDESDSRSVG